MNKLNECPICGDDKLNSFISTNVQMHARGEEFNFDQCENCSLVMLNPRVDIEKIDTYYTHNYLPYRGASAWGRYQSMVENSQNKLDEKRVGLLTKYKTLNEKTTVLDIGCGKPSFLAKCSEKYKTKCIGIDFSDKGWKESSKDFGSIDLLVTDVNNLKLDKSPDIITMWHYLEHDYSPKETLEKLKSIISPKGLVFIEVPNFESESRKEFGDNWAGYHTPRHTFLFSPKTIKQLLKDTGFSIVDIKINGTLDPYNLYWMSKMEKKNIDWSKSMESEFWGYVRGMLLFRVKQLFNRNKSFGVMTIIAQAD
jgi:ubiquinone/menaquinone biosynthesis C-methylase UbiE